MNKNTIHKAYQALVKRINSSSAFISGCNDTFDSEHGCTTRFFWNAAQPAFSRITRSTFRKGVSEDQFGLIKLSLVYGSKTGYSASICDANENMILCLLSSDDFDKISPWLSGWSTMRQCKANLSNDDFKRIWLMTAISCGKDLYKLGHNGKPFLKAGETIESLALEYDLNAKAA